jgi:hypothetical protein
LTDPSPFYKRHTVANQYSEEAPDESGILVDILADIGRVSVLKGRQFCRWYI